MKEKIKVALDVDGVLANFYLAMCIAFDKPYVTIDRWGVPWLDKKLPEVDEVMAFWDTLPNMNNPKAITFDFDYYITAIPAKYHDSRVKWLKQHGYPDKPVIIAFDKAEAMKENGVEILIDDKFENIEKVSFAGLHAIHYVPDYLYPNPQQTHTPKLTIKHLSEAKDIIEKLKEEIEMKHLKKKFV